MFVEQYEHQSIWIALKSFGLYSELVIMNEMCFGDS